MKIVKDSKWYVVLYLFVVGIIWSLTNVYAFFGEYMYNRADELPPEDWWDYVYFAPEEAEVSVENWVLPMVSGIIYYERIGLNRKNVLKCSDTREGPLKNYSSVTNELLLAIPTNPPEEVRNYWDYTGDLPVSEKWCRLYSYQIAVDKKYRITKENLFMSEWIHFVK